MSRVPHHKLDLEIGAHVMYLCNIDQRAGLCNGTRLKILRIGDINIKGRIIYVVKGGEVCAICKSFKYEKCRLN